jgi:hypothetical protein
MAMSKWYLARGLINFLEWIFKSGSLLDKINETNFENVYSARNNSTPN